LHPFWVQGYHAPKIGAMKKFRQPIYDREQTILREWLIERRKEAQLTQRELAEILGVVYSLVGKVETGERRLDVVELIQYCSGLKVDPVQLIKVLKKEMKAG